MLPTAATYIVAWVVVAAAVVRIVQGTVPLVKGIRAAVTLVNEQLAPNHGESLLDKVDEARGEAVRTRELLDAHMGDGHGGQEGGQGAGQQGHRTREGP